MSLRKTAEALKMIHGIQISHQQVANYCKTAVSKEYRPLKQMIERLNRTYKQSYRPTNGFDNIDGANYDLALWVTYYNFLRPHKEFRYKPPIQDPGLAMAGNMPGKWQYLIAMGQQTILNIQRESNA